MPDISHNHAALWVTEPWDTLDFVHETTLRLIKESLNHNLPVYWSDSKNIEKNYSVRRVLRTWELSEPENIALSNFCQIHFRLDPPLNETYWSTLRSIESQLNNPESVIINPPSLLRNQSEKIVPKSLSDLAPLTLLISNEATALEALIAFDRIENVIIKPLGLSQGRGVHRVTPLKTKNEWLDWMRKETLNFTRTMVIQEFLSAIDQGETRLWFVNGVFLAALKKFQKPNFLEPLDEGTHMEKYTLNAAELEIAQRIGATLKSQNAKLAAIDLIGNKISDYNITSPGLLAQLEELHQKNFSQKALELLGLLD